MCAIKISNVYKSPVPCTNYYSCGIMVQLGRDVGGNFNIHDLACSGDFITGGG